MRETDFEGGKEVKGGGRGATGWSCFRGEKGGKGRGEAAGGGGEACESKKKLGSGSQCKPRDTLTWATTKPLRNNQGTTSLPSVLGTVQTKPGPREEKGRKKKNPNRRGSSRSQAAASTEKNKNGGEGKGGETQGKIARERSFLGGCNLRNPKALPRRGRTGDHPARKTGKKQRGGGWRGGDQ